MVTGMALDVSSRKSRPTQQLLRLCGDNLIIKGESLSLCPPSCLCRWPNLIGGFFV